MTDLEDAWNRYPTSAAPTSEILGEVGKAHRVSPRWPALGGLVAAGVAVALVFSFNAGGGGSGNVTAANTPIQVVAFQADLKPANSCQQLLDTYRERGQKTVNAWGWPYSGYGWNFSGVTPAAGTFYRSPFDQRLSGTLLEDGALIPLAQTNSETGTNIQEVGVDEPDTVKTNGTLLVRIDGNTLAIYDLTGAEPTLVSTLALAYFDGGQILLSGSTVVAIGVNTAPHPGRLTARVATVSLDKPSAPVVTSNVTYAGSISSARQHGSDIRIILDTGFPHLRFVHPSKKVTKKEALAANRRAVANSTLKQWLPTVDTGNGAEQLMDCSAIAIPPASVPLGTTSVIGFNVSAPTATSAIGLAGTTTTAYESADHLYLASNGTRMGFCSCLGYETRVPAGASKSNTAIFQFDLIGDQATHVATGTVDGTIRDRWSMDDAHGTLRVATSKRVKGVQTSSVITLKQSGTDLLQLGRLDGLGKGETLTAARWFDDMAVLSTAQEVDPLFTIDLTKPAHPKLLGALHIPGFTNYFHPLGDGLLLGVGQNVSLNSSGERSAAQIGLFDISNLTKVKRVDEVSFGQWSYPLATNDPHAFTWLPDHQTALTFITSGGHIKLATIGVDGHKLTSTLTRVPGNDARAVRTFELPNGKVVLAAGGTVRFLTL